MRQECITRSDLQANLDRLYVFGDNMAGTGRGGQAAEMRVPTKWRPTSQPSAYFTDDDLRHPEVKAAIDRAFEALKAALRQGRTVVVPANGVGTGLAALDTKAPAIYRYIQKKLWELEYGG